ncbi:MAG TPA: DinB family protein [Candidatus Baltobacteraceae bacterium]|nr:DinB family protein [Candidatus Baltobacteraceae bacterium]
MEQAERDRLLNIVRSTPERLKSALTGVPKKLLLWRPAPGKWSIHEIVCHMRDAERLGYLHRYSAILAQDNPTFPDVDGDVLAQDRQYRRMNLRDVLKDWRVARKESLALLKKVKSDQWMRIGTHETAGPMSLETVLQRQAIGNDEAHLAQIEHIKARWALLEKLREAPKALAALFRGVPDEILRRKPAPEKWSMLELVCHLRDVEEFFVERYAKIANHDRPALRGIKQDELAAKLHYNEDDPARVVKEFQAQRADSLAILQALAHQSWQREGMHPTRGAVTIAWTAERAVEHDRNHLRQIQELRQRFGTT